MGFRDKRCDSHVSTTLLVGLGMRLEVIKHEGAKRGFVLLPRRWVVERNFAWASRFRRLVKDYERLPGTLAGLHFVAFACLFLQQAAGILSAGS